MPKRKAEVDVPTTASTGKKAKVPKVKAKTKMKQVVKEDERSVRRDCGPLHPS
jgi:hypothetical protein